MSSKSKRNVGRSRTAVFSMLVQDSMRSRTEVLAVRTGTHCGDMIALLAAEKASCAIVVDAAGRPAGIVTEQDIARRIAYRVPGETPLEAVMTSPVMTIARGDYLNNGISRMRRQPLG